MDGCRGLPGVQHINHNPQGGESLQRLVPGFPHAWEAVGHFGETRQAPVQRSLMMKSWQSRLTALEGLW